MEVDIQKIWATPSTLHLQCVVTGKNRAWIRFFNCHIPLESIPSEVRRLVALSDGFDVVPEEKDEPLW